MIDIVTSFKTTGEKKVTAIVDNLKKSAKQISSKKINVGFGTTGAQRGSFAAVRAEINARKEVTRKESAQAATAGQKKLADMKKEQRENNKLVKSTQAAGNALKDIARGAATLDPAAFLQSMLTAASKAATAIPFLGNIAQSAAEVAGIAVGAAGGALGAAKSAIQNASEIRKRDFSTNLYGRSLQNVPLTETQRAEQDISNTQHRAAMERARQSDERTNAQRQLNSQSVAARRLRAQMEAEVRPMREDARGRVSRQEQQRFRTETANRERARTRYESLYGRVDTAGRLQAAHDATRASAARGNWTPTDYSNFVGAVSAGFGKIQAPLARALREQFMTRDASGRQANVELATQVAGGNWNALGTDEGAILQQISSSFSGALPSIRQAMQAALINQSGGLVEREGADVAAFRQQAGQIQASAERHEINMANVAARNYGDLIRLQESLNGLQLRLINGAAGLADAVATATSSMSSIIPGR